jgi:Uma2 family endonuclease
MTPEEFDAFPEWAWDNRYRYELIRGVLVVTPPVGDAEVDPNQYLGYLLLKYQEGQPEGAILDVTMPERYVPGTENRRRCDRAIWVGLGRLPDTAKDVPTIVVEFVSSQRRDMLRDYETKRDEYLAAGAREYWIIDRFRRIMTIYRKGAFGPVHQIVVESQTYETELLPGFALPLAKLLSLADRWKKTRTRPRDLPKKSHKPKPPAEGSQ